MLFKSIQQWVYVGSGGEVVWRSQNDCESEHQLSNSAALATTETRSKLPQHYSKERARGIRVKLAQDAAIEFFR